MKGKARPLIEEKERAEILSALSCIDYIVFFGNDTPIKEIRDIKPDILAKGGDYKENEVVGHDILKQYGGKVKIIPFVEGYSTTNIIDKILKSAKRQL